jgi:SAM-dependent methyltransferase
VPGSTLLGVTEQPGYDALAELYDQTFASGSASQVERSAIDLFADALSGLDPRGPVVDVGCGTGHQAHDLAGRGFHVIGADPSGGMLERARLRFPELELVQDDALLGRVGVDTFSGVLARYSLIHVPPDDLAGVLSAWADRLQPGGVVLTAFQALPPDAAAEVEEFDHTVARAWRWKPDAVAAALAHAGFTERWRLIAQPGEGYHRFPECHLLHTLSTSADQQSP